MCVQSIFCGKFARFIYLYLEKKKEKEVEEEKQKYAHFILEFQVFEWSLYSHMLENPQYIF